MNTILGNWKAGRGFPDILVIDGHLHFHAWPHGANFDSLAEAVEGALELMDAHGVEAGCVLGGGAFVCGDDYTAGNDELLTFTQACPDRFIGFAHINPNDSEAGVKAELDRIWQMGFRALKLINSYQQNYPDDGSNLMQVYRFAAEKNMLVLNHWWKPEVLDRIAAEFISVQFIAAHFYPFPVLERPNVHCNIWGLPGWIEEAVRRYGAEKFMVGSDGFMNPLSGGIGQVVYLDIPDADKRRMLGLNVARLLDSAGVLPPVLRSKMNLISA